MNKLYVLLLLLHRATSIYAQETPNATRWEASAAFATRYNEDIFMNTKGDIASSTEQSPWLVSVGRRVGNWVLSASHERTVVRHGQAANDELLDGDYHWWLYEDSHTSTYRSDMLTTEQAMASTAFGAADLVRPFRVRAPVGFAVRGELGLRLHRVHAEQGVLADHINYYHVQSPTFYGDPIEERDPGSAALDAWDMRTVVNTAHGTGLSFAMGIRADLHCTRYFSLFSTFGMHIPLVKPRFDSHAVPDTDMEFAAYSVDLTGLRASIGAAVYF